MFVWANFLHIYQPPTQTRRIVDRVTAESYRRIFAGLRENPHAKLTLNMTSCLTELLDKFGHDDVIADVRFLLERGQLELTASAKFHPLLPKMPKDEIIRQIQLDLETNRKYFGEAYNPRGFFPPESAYDRRLASIVAELGFEWILAEELSYKGTFGEVKPDQIYEVSGIHSPTPSKPLKIFFRERSSSFRVLSGQLGTVTLFEDYLKNRLNKDEYMLTAMDGETFGHHRPGMEKLLLEIYRSPHIKTVTISELTDLYPKTEVVETCPSTWALMEKDLEKNSPFSRWDDSENIIHAKQWALTDLAINSVNNSAFKVLEATQNSAETQQWLKARQLLDRSLHSDQYWWASARPWWSLEMIESGANELKDVVMTVPDSPDTIKNQALNLYYEIITTGFKWQRDGTVEMLSLKEDEEVRERTDEGLPKLPLAEIDKMIATIREEMLSVAGKQEYERAAQLRDRIDELEDYKKQ